MALIALEFVTLPIQAASNNKDLHVLDVDSTAFANEIKKCESNQCRYVNAVSNSEVSVVPGEETEIVFYLPKCSIAVSILSRPYLEDDLLLWQKPGTDAVVECKGTTYKYKRVALTKLDGAGMLTVTKRKGQYKSAGKLWAGIIFLPEI